MAKYYIKQLKTVFFIYFTLVVIFLSFIPIATYAKFANDFSTREKIMNKNKTGVILLDRHNRPFFEFYQAKLLDGYTPLSEIPDHAKQAVVAAEDKDFYKHPGFSVKAILRAFFTTVTNGEVISGASTITQQLVRNVFLSPKKSYLRKYQEIVLAQEIERKYTKYEILEMYLNSVYFGEGAFGIEQAAKIYFNKKPKDLNIAESAMLAGLLSAPSRSSPISGSFAIAKERQAYVLNQMAKEGYISKEESDIAQIEPLQIQDGNNYLNRLATHFALMIRDKLIKTYGEEVVSRSGFRVKTTLDLDWQEYAEKIVREQVARLSLNNVSNASVVVLDPKTGEIMVMVGSVDWQNNSFGKVNVALSPRQPGSSFKPIVYGAALDQKVITAATILEDKPTTFPGGYKPKNFDGKFRGKISVRKSLGNSLNVPSVEVINKFGVISAINAAQRFGISTITDPSNYGLSLVLGAGEVKLLDLTNAYSIFANNGEKNEIIDILSIEDKNNKTIYKSVFAKSRVISEEAAFLISSILSDTNARRDVFGNVLNISRVAAVKTGTTENFKDSLTMGYVPNLAVGVWVGNNNGAPMDNVAGSLGAAPIWKQLMEYYLSTMPVETFKIPSGIVTCGRLPNVEYFIRGTEPNNFCFSQKQPSVSPSLTNSPTPSLSAPSPTLSPTPTLLPSSTITPIPTLTPSLTPTLTPTQTPIPTSTLTPTPTSISPLPSL